jgi:hypothetical protein
MKVEHWWEKISKGEDDLASPLPTSGAIEVLGCSPIRRMIKRKGGSIAAVKYYDLRRVMKNKLNFAELHKKELHQKLNEAQMRAEKYRIDLRKVQSWMRKAEYQLKQFHQEKTAMKPISIKDGIHNALDGLLRIIILNIGCKIF